MALIHCSAAHLHIAVYWTYQSHCRMHWQQPGLKITDQLMLSMIVLHAPPLQPHAYSSSCVLRHLAPLHMFPTAATTVWPVTTPSMLLPRIQSSCPHALHLRLLPHICGCSAIIIACYSIQQGGSSENVPAGGMLPAIVVYTTGKQRNRQA